MKSVINNLRDGVRYRRAALLVPTLLLPIAAMGITTPTYLEYRSAKHDERIALEGFSYAAQMQSQWRSEGDIAARLSSLEEVNAMLKDLIPDWQEELVVHGAVRDAAGHVGLQLSRIQMSDPERRGAAVQGYVVVERMVSLAGEGPGDAALDLVDRLRGQGWPTCVHSLDANADMGSRDRFGFELRLGIFHYAPAADFVLPDPIGEEGIPTLEEPIE